MKQIHETQISEMRVRNKRLAAESNEQPKPAIDWDAPPKKHPGESLTKNLAVAGALVLCAVTLRTGAIPSLTDPTDAILTAATDQSLLDEQLGKLSFVSTLFPEAVLVFGESQDEPLARPVSSGYVVHAWSAEEPYMSWRTSSRQVRASSDGEVTGVYHGNGDERIVQVLSNDGLVCLYGNLTATHVAAGDSVVAGDVVGTLIAGEDFVFEVRRNGVSIDPALYFAQ